MFFHVFINFIGQEKIVTTRTNISNAEQVKCFPTFLLFRCIIIFPPVTVNSRHSVHKRMHTHVHACVCTHTPHSTHIHMHTPSPTLQLHQILTVIPNAPVTMHAHHPQKGHNRTHKRNRVLLLFAPLTLLILYK